MKVSTRIPFQIVYSLFDHQYLGYLFESFAVQLDHKNKLTLQHQNISSQNAHEFDRKLDDADYELIQLIDDIQQDAVLKKFGPKNKKMTAERFFLSVYDDQKGDKTLQEAIHQYLEEKRAKILSLLYGKMVFEMGNDGEPTAKTIRVNQEKANIRFILHRNSENTHYFPHISYRGERVENLHHRNAILLCANPAWIVMDGQLLTFEQDIDGNKLRPFLSKKFIAIPKKIEDSYYDKFVKHLIEDFEVEARGEGLKIQHIDHLPPQAKLHFAMVSTTTNTLFDSGKKEEVLDEKVTFSLDFYYGKYSAGASSAGKPSYVELTKTADGFTFCQVKRDIGFEHDCIKLLQELGMDIYRGKSTMPKQKAFSWLAEHRDTLAEEGIEVHQRTKGEKQYFVGNSSINLEIRENHDWFDIHAKVMFGPFEVSFLEIRKLIVAGKNEFTLPNGEIAVIPDSWFTKYYDLFHFMENGSEHRLKKHHLAVVQELQEGALARVSFNRKLEKLKDFEKIDDFAIPDGFEGQLRPYQKAGYNWMNFLSEYNFGGCLADDMGLGKTVQTLAMLQNEKENSEGRTTSLLIMPTSLLYNWEMEAKKFTPNLKVLNYTGTNRNKNPEIFGWYDLVITSYGIARIDVDILEKFYFNYIILDESQTIKNPNSNIAKAVKKLKSKKRLILTGTPIENTTMDLWSQMSFVNPGLLGSQSFFKREFLLPIEKKNDEAKYRKLHSIIKPFILRRHKSQVATELPGKVEKVHYSTMTDEQQKVYEATKSSYRNEILEHIEDNGLNGSQLMLLKGLTELRQLANHPKMLNEEYEGSSGKLDDVIQTLDNVLANDHKILIFSQFVKHLQIVKKHLEKKRIPFSYLDGSTKDRQSEVNQFQNDPRRQVFLISLKAGGLGLNLTAADYVFILDPWWNPAIEAQAVDRAHRIGQENKVFIYKFISKDTVEEKILALQKSKMDLANSLISTEESFMKKLTKEDIEALFE
ncbi:DEAD/DEAH box helicase [Limibacter armeniacum]|uniref:DEAD/DEAH box helicase n=1 Tax=Limibacter armeniacum TaxID=466084 RepID=UPI002FE62ADA